MTSGNVACRAAQSENGNNPNAGSTFGSTSAGSALPFQRMTQFSLDSKEIKASRKSSRSSGVRTLSGSSSKSKSKKSKKTEETESSVYIPQFNQSLSLRPNTANVDSKFNADTDRHLDEAWILVAFRDESIHNAAAGDPHATSKLYIARDGSADHFQIQSAWLP